MNNNNNNAPAQAGYGFAEQAAPNQSSFVFGLNAGNVRLTKFAHTTTGGKDGAELEAMDINFNIEGKDRGYRQFPVTKAYVPDPQNPGASLEITEETHPGHEAIGQGKQLLSAILIHIVGCFVEKTEIQAALAVQIQSFKHYCTILQDLLPTNFSTKPLDAFGVWQWNIRGEANNTYLEFPKNMKHGRWLEASITPVGEWEKQQNPVASSNEVALRYVDADGNKHPFTRNGWFMESNFATQQKEAQSSGESAMQKSASESSGGEW
jgi:hypothetical protein